MKAPAELNRFLKLRTQQAAEHREDWQRKLAARIIHQAIWEYTHGRYMDKRSVLPGEDPVADAAAFFASEDFENWCCHLGLEPDRVRQAIRDMRQETAE